MDWGTLAATISGAVIAISPAVFGWTEWGGLDRCPLCRPGLDAAASAAGPRSAIETADASTTSAEAR